MDKQSDPIRQNTEAVESKLAIANPFQNFMSAFLLSGILVFVAISGSAYASYTPLSELGFTKLAVSAVIPIVCGVWSVASKGKFVDALVNATSNWSGF